MMRRLLIVVAVAVACAGPLLTIPTFADAPSPAAAQNQATVDVTLTDAGYLTVGGIDLKALGVGQLDGQTTGIAKNLGAVHLVVQAETVTADVQGTPILKLTWNQASRQALVDLAAKYGFIITPDVMTRVEEWITSSNLDVTARFSNQPSKPLAIKLGKPLWVDLGSNGEVAIEKGPLAYGIDQSVMGYIKMAGAKNASACWNKGTLVIKADGKALPSITLDPKGTQMIVKALNLMVDSVDPFFAATIGVDVSLPGGAHQVGATCGD